MSESDAEGPKAKCAKLEDTTNTDLAFQSPWHHSDLVLNVEGHKFHVHKCILSMSSPVFDAMFNSDFQEKRAAEISLPGKSAKEFEVLLKLIYAEDKPSVVTNDNFEFLLKLTDEYQMDRFKRFCTDFMNSSVTPLNCLHFYQVANQYDLNDVVKTKCIDLAKQLSTNTIESSKWFADTTLHGKFKLCMEKSKAMEDKVRELESNLAEYAKTCSELVMKVYKCAAKHLGKFDCDRYYCHTAVYKDRFNFRCECCIRRLERNWPDATLLYHTNILGAAKSQFLTLRSLQDKVPIELNYC